MDFDDDDDDDDDDDGDSGRALEAKPSPNFSEIMHITWQLEVIKYGTKALNCSKMVAILNWISLIWHNLGLIGLRF